MSLLYEHKRDKKGNEYIAVTGYEGELPALIIPDSIEDLPVREISAGAFSGRKDIREVMLPDTIEVLGRYAFYNCTNLVKIELSDGVEDYYDGVIKQCRSLRDIRIDFERDNYSVMRDMLRDNDRKLRFDLYLKEGISFSLTFPAYVYDFVEDVEARVLHHKIEGAGYPYRECVTRTEIDFITYDRLFEHAVSDSIYTAAEIALDRLMYPYNLNGKRAEDYSSFVLAQSENILEYLIDSQAVKALSRHSMEIIEYMCKNRLITKEAVEKAIKPASDKNMTEVCALLMNYQNENYGLLIQNTSNELSLEDW